MSRRHAILAAGAFLWLGTRLPAQSLGPFTGSGDAGVPSTIGPGSAAYDADTKIYSASYAASVSTRQLKYSSPDAPRCFGSD